MGILTLFEDPALEQAHGVFTPELLRQHATYVESLQQQGRVHSTRRPPSEDSPTSSELKMHGYVLICSTAEEAKIVAQNDPLWTPTNGNVHFIPWNIERSAGTTGAGENTTVEKPSLGFDPIFPVTDMQRSLLHYKLLGFETTSFDDAYAFAELPGLGILHLSLQSQHDPKVDAAATYLHVEDADELAARWRRDCPQGDTREVVDTDYGLREGAHLDPDNNLMRFGSKMK